MTIRNRQIYNATQNALTTELKAGRYPDADSIHRLVLHKFKNLPAGLPRFQHTPTLRGETSNPEQYNKDILNIYEDLSTAIQELQEQSLRLNSVDNLYATDRLLIERQIRLLERRVENLQQRATLRASSIFNTFVDFRHVEMSGRPTRGISATDAMVDLRHNHVSLKGIPSLSKIYPLSGVGIEYRILSPYRDYKNLAPLDNLLSYALNESWCMLVTNDKPQPISMEIILDLKREIPISTLSIVNQSVKDTRIELALSLDKTIWQEHSAQETIDVAKWIFSAQQARYIKILLHKVEPDNNDGLSYQYYFGLQNVIIGYEEFEQSSVLVSKPHPLHRPVRDVKLETDAWLPAGTNIRYYVGLDDGESAIHWNELQSGQTINLRTTETREMLVDRTTPEYGQLHVTQHGIGYHSVGSLNEAFRSSTVKLYSGMNMWSKETTSKSVDYTTPDLRDWVNAQGITTTFVPGDSSSHLLPLDENKSNRFTIYVSSKENISLETVINRIGNCNFSLYVNNTKIQPNNNIFRCNFIQGWNKIQICTFALAPNCELEINLDLRDIGQRIYANNRALTLVSPHDFYNNTLRGDFTRFTIDGNKIIVNYNPIQLDVSQSTGVLYHLIYEHPRVDTTNHSLRFMAILERKVGIPSLTPYLKEYRLFLS